MRARLAGIPGLADLQVEKQVLIPQLEIRVDYGRAALYGVQPAAVVDQLSRLSNGRVVSRVVDGYRRFDVTMRLPDRLRTTQRLGDLLIETPVGWIPARQVADIKETEGPNQILRENGAPPRRGARQHRRPRRHGADRRRRSGGSWRATKLPRRVLHAPGRHLPGAGGGEPDHRRALAAVARR